MSLVFYWHPMSSASPVAAALAELAVPHEAVRIDIRSGEQRSPEYLAINPNGKVPCLVVDGTPMFEGLAILQWLGAQYGVAQGLWPQDGTPERLQALSWTTWAYVTYNPLLIQLWTASQDGALRSAEHATAALDGLRHLQDLLEARLAAQDWMVGQDYSLVDLVLGSVLGYGTFFGATLDGHPHVQAWLARVKVRPSMQGDG